MGLNTELVESISKDRSAEAVKLLLETLADKYDVSPDQVVKAFYSDSKDIPLSAFAADKLSVLEIVVKYLREEIKLKYSEIARLLNRDDRTIWSTYNNSRKKSTEELDLSSAETLPLSIFSDRKISVLQSVCVYLKNQGHSFSDIAKLLKKDYQTIYTSYKRGEAR